MRTSHVQDILPPLARVMRRHVRTVSVIAAFGGVVVGVFLWWQTQLPTAAATVQNTRAKTVTLFAGQYSGDGTTGQNSDTNQTFPSSTFRLGESSVVVRNAFVQLEAQLNAYTDTGNVTGHQIAFDTCAMPCSPDAWSGSGRVLQDASTTVLQYQDVTGSTFVRLLADVTAETQLAAYAGSMNQLAYQVGYRFNHGAAAASVGSARAKLYVTYAYDADSSEVTNTVVYPLESTASGNQGSRTAVQATACTLNTNCPIFNYTMTIPELTISSQRVAQWFEVGGFNDANAAADVVRTANIQGTDVDASQFVLEAVQGTEQGNWSEAWWSDISGFAENTAQQLEERHTGGSQYLIGGEVLDTYVASSTAVTSTKTVSFPIGVISNGVVTGAQTAGTTVYFPESGVKIKKAWLRTLVSGYDTNGNVTVVLSTKVGSNTTSSDTSYLFNSGLAITEAFRIIHVVSSSADYATLETATATSGVPVVVTATPSATSIDGISAELMVTYTYTNENKGYLSSLTTYGGQNVTAGNDQAATVSAANGVFPETSGEKTVRGAALRASFSISDSDNAVPTVVVPSDANLSTGSPNCVNTVNGDTDGATAFYEFYRDVASGLGTTDNQTYQACYSNNGGADATAGAKMNGMLTYTYQTDLPTYQQSGYRWFSNLASTTVGGVLAATNTAAIAPIPGDPFRLRMLLHVGTGQLATSSESFKLQYATSTPGGCDVGFSGETYVDVSDSTGTVRFADNAGVADGAVVATTSSDPVHGGDTIRRETYEESNPFSNGGRVIGAGEDGLWDFALTTVNAPPQTTYCFRAVKSDNVLLDTYSVVPEIKTRGTVIQQEAFRMYRNLDALQPVQALGDEDAAVASVDIGSAVRIRMGLQITNQALATGTQTFALQFAERSSSTADCAAISPSSFAFVGPVGATTTLWRGTDNASVSDGATMSGLLLSTSTVRGTYEEENSSTANPFALALGSVVEYDWAIENYAAPITSAYCFRAVRGDGSELDAYPAYPAVAQQAPATWRAIEDTPTSTVRNTNVRVRVQFSNLGNITGSARLRLEYGMATSGPWTVVPVDPTCTSESADFRICPSTGFTDSDPTTAKLTAGATTFVSGLMIESASPAPTTTLAVDEYSEYEWNIQATDVASETSTYFFRATDNGTPLGAYPRYPQLGVETGTSTITQARYRWYANNGVLLPTDPWPSGATDIGENVPLTESYGVPVSGDVLRLRIAFEVSQQNLPTSSRTFKLQFGTRPGETCDTVTTSTWQDVGSLASAAAWRAYDNTSTADGTVLSGNPPTGGDLMLASSDRAGTYEEENPSSPNPYRVPFNDSVEYDWVIQQNNAPGGDPYCFRMVYADGTLLEGYDTRPQIILPTYTAKSQNWRWYDDETNETPSAPLAGENIAPTDIVANNIIKLRVTAKETANATGTALKFKLQFSRFSDFSGEVFDVAESSTCSSGSLWCYADGAGNDNDPISATVLSDVDSCTSGSGPGCGTHNESGVSSSTFAGPRLGATEFEFTLRNYDADRNTAYFFRLYDVGSDVATVPSGGESYPSLLTEGAKLTFVVGGLGSGISTESVVTDATTTPTAISFDTLVFDAERTAAQRLTITTNAANGYQVFMLQNQRFLNDLGYQIPPIVTPNSSPAAWASACAATSTGCYGYHTGDDSLFGGSTRFAPDNTYARFSTSSDEIAFSAASAATDTIDVIFKAQVRAAQPPGTYRNSVAYIVVPTF